MNARNRHLINILSTGVLVTVLLLAGLFWARWYCHLVRVSALHDGTAQAQISPIGLFPFESAEDPNRTKASSAAVELNASVGLLWGLGTGQYLMANFPGAPGSNVFRWDGKEDGTLFYYDPALGLIVYARMSDVPDPNGTTRRRYITQFAGPEGIAETPDERLGRFASPMISDGFAANLQTVYEERHRCFFAIHWRDGLVRKGPELVETDAPQPQPVRIGMLQTNPMCLNMTTQYEQRPTEQQSEARQAFYTQLPQTESWPVLVLDASGRIDLLNPDTLTLTRGVARLPTPPTLFENPRPVGPEDVAGFIVYPVCVYRKEAQKKWAYVGCIAAAVSPDLTGVQLTVFDPNGRSVTTKAIYPDADKVYFSLPGASLVTVVQYILENLHPPASLALSSLTASQVPAASAWRSFVLLPNSFAAMAARDMDLGPVNRFASSLVFMAPAIGLGVFLAWRVSRDAVRMGLSKQEKTLWTLGTFVMGLPAYITYRLTRPTVALVTCGNCGQGRRADFGKCQRCGAPWSVPELIPPTWRVLGEPESADDASPFPAQETNQSM